MEENQRIKEAELGASVSLSRDLIGNLDPHLKRITVESGFA